MDWSLIETRWHEFKASAKREWDKLSEDPLSRHAGQPRPSAQASAGSLLGERFMTRDQWREAPRVAGFGVRRLAKNPEKR